VDHETALHSTHKTGKQLRDKIRSHELYHQITHFDINVSNIHRTIWPQYTNVTDRTDRQTGQTDSTMVR